MNFPLLCESLTCKSWFYPLWNLFSFFSLVKKRRKLVKERRRCPVLSRKNHLKVQLFFFWKETITVFIIAEQNICLSFLIEVKIFFSSNCIFSPQIPSWHSLTFPYPKHQLVFKCRVGLGRSSRHLKGKSCPQMILIPKTSVPPNKWTVILWELCLLPFNL